MCYDRPQYEQQHQLEEQARRQRYDPSDAPSRFRPDPLAVFLGLLVLLLLIFMGTTIFTFTH